MKKTQSEKGFTLIELLVVIFIIAILVGFVLTNFVGARERARDSKKKAELQQLKTALRLYNNDYGRYPNQETILPQKTKIYGCGTDGLQACPWNNCANEFSAGGDGCSSATVYMKILPSYTIGTFMYFQLLNGDDFLAKASLENKGDPDAATSKKRCPGSGSSTCGNGDYCVCAD